MRINSINTNQSFNSQLSPRVEEGFKKLGNGILAGYGKDSKQYNEYLLSLVKIKSVCPYTTIDIEDCFEKSDISGMGILSASGKTSVVGKAYVLKNKYLPDQILTKVENSKDLFSFETFKDVANGVFRNRSAICNETVDYGDYAAGKAKMFLKDREKSTEYLRDEINPIIEDVFKKADSFEK